MAQSSKNGDIPDFRTGNQECPHLSMSPSFLSRKSGMSPFLLLVLAAREVAMADEGTAVGAVEVCGEALGEVD
jgi:hypothetical protein